MPMSTATVVTRPATGSRSSTTAASPPGVAIREVVGAGLGVLADNFATMRRPLLLLLAAPPSGPRCEWRSGWVAHPMVKAPGYRHYRRRNAGRR